MKKLLVLSLLTLGSYSAVAAHCEESVSKAMKSVAQISLESQIKSVVSIYDGVYGYHTNKYLVDVELLDGSVVKYESVVHEFDNIGGICEIDSIKRI